NIERLIATGLDARTATIQSMGEITGPIIAVTLVLISVFLPAAFLPGITGQFYRQFALTIAATMVISALNAMTLTPSRAVALIRPVNFVLGRFFRAFNSVFGLITAVYGRLIAGLVRVSLLGLLLYGGLLYLTYHNLTTAPRGFIPEQDQGYLLVNVQLPDSASV